MTLKTSWGLKLMTICTTRFKSKVMFQCNWIKCNFAELEAGLDVFFGLGMSSVLTLNSFNLIILTDFLYEFVWPTEAKCKSRYCCWTLTAFLGKCCSFHFNINFNSSVKKSLWILKSTCCFISMVYFYCFQLDI